MENRAIVTITRKLPKLPGGPILYEGVTELSNTGYTRVEIALPYGVEDFPTFPYMVTAGCETAFCEFRKGMLPLLTITEWEPMQHYYM